ncbi:MAG: YbaK/EbsC family protein [Nitriliruptoraceae bacterium]
MSAETVHTFLDEHDVTYEVHEHPRAISASHLAQSEDVTGWDVAKPVLLAIGDELAMAVVPSAVHVDLDKASEVLGHSPVRLATEDEFASRFPDSERGAEPPFGNLYGIPVFLDESLRARQRMVCRDGSHTSSITLAVADYVRVVAPEIVDLATAPI